MSEKRKMICVFIILGLLLIGLILMLFFSRVNQEKNQTSIVIQTEQESVITSETPTEAVQALNINASIQTLPAEGRLITTVPETVQNTDAPVQTLPAEQFLVMTVPETTQAITEPIQLLPDIQ